MASPPNILNFAGSNCAESYNKKLKKCSNGTQSAGAEVS